MVHTNPVVTGKIESTFKTLCTLTFFILALVITFSISDGYATNTICYLVVIVLSYILYYRMLYHCDRIPQIRRMIGYSVLIIHLTCTIIFVILYYTGLYVVFGISSLWLILLYQFFVIFLMIKPCNVVVKQFSHNLHVSDEEAQTTDYVSTADM